MKTESQRRHMTLKKNTQRKKIRLKMEHVRKDDTQKGRKWKENEDLREDSGRWKGLVLDNSHKSGNITKEDIGFHLYPSKSD
jgi:hypothetical protein